MKYELLVRHKTPPQGPDGPVIGELSERKISTADQFAAADYILRNVVCWSCVEIEIDTGRGPRRFVLTEVPASQSIPSPVE